MFAKSIASVFCFLAAFAVLTNAAVVENEKRQLDSIVNSLTSDVGSIINQGTSLAGSIFTDVTGVAGNVATIVTSVGGKAATIITSAGGQAITLAESGVGVATSFAGSVYEIATATPTASSPASTNTLQSSGTNNAAFGMHPVSVSTPLLSGLLTIFASMFLGAWVAL